MPATLNYTEQNIASLMLNQISFQIFLRAVYLMSVSQSKTEIQMKNETIILTRIDLNLIRNSIYDVLGYLAKDEVKNYCTHIKTTFRPPSVFSQ